MVDVRSEYKKRYDKNRRHRDVTRAEIEENILIDPVRGCWLWQGKTTPKGYGFVRSWRHYAHREAYKLWIGPIEEGMVLDHRCSVKGCCNPAHMVQVPPGLNTQLAFVEKHKQMPWKSLRVARHLHNMVGEPSLYVKRSENGA